jgi:hypothetical protein
MNHFEVPDRLKDRYYDVGNFTLTVKFVDKDTPISKWSYNSTFPVREFEDEGKVDTVHVVASPTLHPLLVHLATLVARYRVRTGRKALPDAFEATIVSPVRQTLRITHIDFLKSGLGKDPTLELYTFDGVEFDLNAPFEGAGTGVTLRVSR